MEEALKISLDEVSKNAIKDFAKEINKKPEVSVEDQVL